MNLLIDILLILIFPIRVLLIMFAKLGVIANRADNWIFAHFSKPLIVKKNQNVYKS